MDARKDCEMTDKQKLEEDIKTIRNALDMREPEDMDRLDHRALEALSRIEAALPPCEGERAAMAAEVERLRGALEQTLKAYIAVMSSHYDYPNDAWIDRPNKVREEAQAALAGGKEE